VSEPRVPQPDRLWTFEFGALTVIAMLGFCNIAIFYSFHGYLARLGIPMGVRGILIGLEPLTAFLLRPILAPMLTEGNGVRWMQAGLIAVALALLAYGAYRLFTAFK
jgi:hypothetical protein